MNAILFSLLVVGITQVAGFLLHAVIFYVMKFSFGKKKAIVKELQIIFDYQKNPSRSLILAFALEIGLPLTRFPSNIQMLIAHGVHLWVIGSFGWMAINAVYGVRDIIMSRYEMGVPDNLLARRMYTQIHIIEKIIVSLILLFTIAFMLMTFSMIKQIGVSLLASAGIAGVVLGFAAQKTLGNVLAGIQIAISQPIRIDDVVIIENEWGWIEDITLTYVVLRIWDLRRLIIPISYFVEKPFQNWTRSSANLLGTVFIYTDYTLPVEEVRKELTRLLEKSLYWDKKVNVLQVTEAKEHTVELRALMSAADSSTLWNLRCEIRENLLDFLQKRFPHSLPRLRVDMKDET